MSTSALFTSFFLLFCPAKILSSSADSTEYISTSPATVYQDPEESSTAHRRRQLLEEDAVSRAISRLEEVKEQLSIEDVGEDRQLSENLDEASEEPGESTEQPPASLSEVNSEDLLPRIAALPANETYGECKTRQDCGHSRMMCVAGNCRCPVLFHGESCEQPRIPTESWCLTPFKEWPAQAPVYRDLQKQPYDFTSCAVIGSSGLMKRSGRGKEIDAHTAIFRFNEAPATKIYMDDVGSFTTLRFQNRDRSGYAEKKGEICVVRAGKWQRGQDSGGKCSFQQMPDAIEKYVDGHWKQYRQGASWPSADPGRPWFSNGFAGITFALHMCARVDVYGFTFNTGYYFPKYRGKAKNWGRRGGFIRPPSKALENRHSWTRERSCLIRLAEELPAQLTVQLVPQPAS